MSVFLALVLSQSSVRICDKANITRCATVNADGSMPSTLAAGATVTATQGTGGTSAWRFQLRNPLDSAFLGDSTNPIIVAWATAQAVTQSGAWTVAATQSTSPWVTADNHTTAGAPLSFRLSDGAAFLSALAVTGTFWPTVAASPASHRLSDGSAFYDAAKTGQLPAALVSGRLDVNVGAAVSAGATGSAVPTSADYGGVNENGTLRGLLQCDKTAKADIATATTTSLIAVSGATTIYVCSYAVEIQGVATTAGTMVLEYGTGATCTTPVALTPTWTGSTTAGAPTVFAEGGNTGYVFKTIASQGLCALSTTTTPQRVRVSYGQF